MAKLFVQATRGLQATVKESTKTPVVLSVSVKARGGKPITGLGPHRFDVTVLAAPIIGGKWGPSAGPIEIASVAEVTSKPGFYRVGIKPGQDLAWGGGDYVVDLRVERKRLEQHGATATFVMDTGHDEAEFTIKSAKSQGSRPSGVMPGQRPLDDTHTSRSGRRRTRIMENSSFVVRRDPAFRTGDIRNERVIRHAPRFGGAWVLRVLAQHPRHLAARWHTLQHIPAPLSTL